MNDAERARVQELVTLLGLSPHPERGFFIETYRSTLELPAVALPHAGPRAASTAIYYLVTDDEPTTYLHRLRSDEIFHLYEGGPLEILLLAPDGSSRLARLGRDLARGERPQIVIPAGTWFGTELAAAPYALVGCTVAPGFAFADFELEPPADLARQHAAHAARIARMTRGRR